MTVTITATNATTGTMSGFQDITIVYSGSDISSKWSAIKTSYDGTTLTNVSFNDATHTVTATQTIPPSSPITDMSGAQINQNGTKYKLPAGVIGEGASAITFTKQ